MLDVKVEGLKGPAQRYQESCGYDETASDENNVELDSKLRPVKATNEKLAYFSKSSYIFKYSGDKLITHTKKYQSKRENWTTSSEFEYDKSGTPIKKTTRHTGEETSVSWLLKELSSDITDFLIDKSTGNFRVSYRSHHEVGIGPREVVYDASGRMLYQKTIGEMMFGSKSGFNPRSISEQSWLYEVDSSGKVRKKQSHSIINGKNILTGYEIYNENGLLVERWSANMMPDGSYSAYGRLFTVFYEIDNHGSWTSQETWQIGADGKKLKIASWCKRQITYGSR